MRTGIDRLFDNAEARGEARGEINGVIEAAFKLCSKGKTVQEVTELLDLTDEQVKALKIRAGLITDAA